MMLDAQDGGVRRRARTPEHRHPYMWAVKPHYFTPFYNWPYTFGLLFGIGLYAGTPRIPSGSAPATTTCCRAPGWPTRRRSPAAFGFDVRDPAFWASSLAVIRHHIDDFEGLVDTGD